MGSARMHHPWSREGPIKAACLYWGLNLGPSDHYRTYIYTQIQMKHVIKVHRARCAFMGHKKLTQLPCDTCELNRNE